MVFHGQSVTVGCDSGNRHNHIRHLLEHFFQNKNSRDGCRSSRGLTSAENPAPGPLSPQNQNDPPLQPLRVGGRKLQSHVLVFFLLNQLCCPTSWPSSTLQHKMKSCRSSAPAPRRCFTYPGSDQQVQTSRLRPDQTLCSVWSEPAGLNLLV